MEKRESILIETCLSGNKLYGDDFSHDEVQAWFADEEEAFANLGAKDREHYCYEYHGLNRIHGFDHLPSRNYNHALSIGGAYGEELRPFVANINSITILEPSDAFLAESLNGVPIKYVKPLATGKMPFGDATFDLTTCFGCLHHIPNVSTVLKELYRCLKPNGFALMREPIISMGDWRQERKGLTKRERGIPLQVFRQMLVSNGFNIQNETLCCFPLISRLGHIFRMRLYNSPVATRVDRLLSNLFAWNYRYHPVRHHHKAMPIAAAYVLWK